MLIPEGGMPVRQAFWDFMNVMGKEINLENWTGYRGDMPQLGTTYHDNFKGIDGAPFSAILISFPTITVSNSNFYPQHKVKG